MNDYRRDFIAFAIASGVLRFGSFVTKSGRTTPYFFDAGLFNTGGRRGVRAEVGTLHVQAVRRAGRQLNLRTSWLFYTSEAADEAE